MSEQPMYMNTSEENDACVVCFKNVEIYSIGECDHPVCYECSTRMRVLCKQNECPICRHDLLKVIFTYDKLPYRELEETNRSEFYNQKYKICFYTNNIQRAFYDLLEHPCPKCNARPYRTFEGLRNHVRKEHDLYYCDLCTDNLKIFTFERRCYTQAELGLHRTKGDEDNRSHRGHPLCEYCNKRYLDRDVLFLHLRREHYFCHFCDADGCNEFYRDYDALADHFRQDHFLCEEGKCATDQFIGAFRTEIDYKAHVASVHGKLLNKQQAKQARTLNLEITLGPRGRSSHTEQGVASLRSRGNEENRQYHDELDDYNLYTSQSNQRSITIDAQNEQDFPSLGGSASGPSVSLIRPLPQSMRYRGNAGLARTKENFPALGSGGGEVHSGTVADQQHSQQNQQSGPISSVLKKQNTSSTGAIARTPTMPNTNGNGSSMVIHVSNRPAQGNLNGGATPKKPTGLDFPALSGNKAKKQQIHDDMLPSSSNIPMENVAAKHRILLDDYVSVANPSNFQKIQLVQKEELAAKARKSAEQMSAPKLTTTEFPSLGGGGNNTTAVRNSISWFKGPSEKKLQEKYNKQNIKKIAPAPPLPKDSNKAMSNKQTFNNTTHQESALKKDKKNKEKKSSTEFTSKSNGKVKEKNNSNNNEQKLSNTSTSHLEPLVNGNDASNNAAAIRPPPGFLNANNQSNSVNPPPGFHSNVTVNSVAKSPNNLTFTSSLGESYSIVPTHAYVQPPEAITRNQRLVSHFKKALKTPESLEEFRHISQIFREGIYKTQPYYEHCQAVLREKFDTIFPELLALLPDISKQQALYLVHTQRLNKLSSSQRKLLPKLEVCPTCKQVLLHTDLDNHRKLHDHKTNFPELGSGNTNGNVTNNKTAVANRK